MTLTDTTIRQLKTPDKTRKVADEKALYLELSPAGGKLWRFKYRVGNPAPHRRTFAYSDESQPEYRLTAGRPGVARTGYEPSGTTFHTRDMQRRHGTPSTASRWFRARGQG